MRPLESMRRHMEPLGLFSRAQGTLLDADLQACAAALDIAYDAVVEFGRESFLATAQGWGLTGKADALGLGGAGSLLRGAALYQLAAAHKDGPFTFSDARQLAAAAGIPQAQIYEQPDQGAVFFDAADPPDDPDWSARFLRRFLPGHLRGTLDLRAGARWADLDARARTWADLDARESAWADFEGHDTFSF